MAGSKRLNVILWVLQVLLALLFFFTGTIKCVMPGPKLAAQSHLPVALLRFVGVAEICGAFGLLLPGLTGIQPFLTPLAAAGLVIIMIGATITSIPYGFVALLPLCVGIIAAGVAWSRWRVEPHLSRSSRRPAR